jgi:gluconolactonase
MKISASVLCHVLILVLVTPNEIMNATVVCAAGEQPEVKSLSKPYPTFGTIQRVDPKIDSLLPADAKMEKLAEGFEWCEGPIWSKDGGYLLFSDIPRNSVMKWKDGEGISLYMKPSGYTGIADYGREPGSNANTFDSQGRLTQCEHGDRRISVLTKNGGKRTLADNYQGKRLNSPNDLCFDSKGNLYFTDPPYGLPKHWDDERRELDFCGVYQLHKSLRRPLQTKRIAPDGKPVYETLNVDDPDFYELRLVTDQMTRPNGIALSPDEKKLYVANSDGPDKALWMVFDVQPDGTYLNAKGNVFFDASDWFKAGKKGNPDGMKIDRDGNLWATGPGGLHIFTPEGKHLGTINPNTGDPVSNCAWGDDGSTLYMTVNHMLARIKTKTKGAGW